MKWFRSYLTGRSQYIRVNGCCSSSQHLLQGAAQGSVLGPILFIAFINGMLLGIWDSTLDVYADDTTLSKSASWENISHINHALNQDLKRLAKWSAQNEMFMNTQKNQVHAGNREAPTEQVCLSFN